MTNGIFISSICTAFGQSVISGMVKDARGKGLAYANIGIKNRKNGTVSTIEGKFNISTPDLLLKDPITFSSIGFKDKICLINLAVKVFGEKTN